MSERVKAGLKRTNKRLGRPTLSVTTIVKITELKNEGLSNRKIGIELGISHTTVARELKKRA